MKPNGELEKWPKCSMLKSPISEIVPLGLSIKIVELGKLIETNQAQEA